MKKNKKYNGRQNKGGKQIVINIHVGEVHLHGEETFNYQADSKEHLCECDCCDCDMDQQMEELHDQMIQMLCERTGISEEEAEQKLMEISKAMNAGIDAAMSNLDDFLAKHQKLADEEVVEAEPVKEV